MEHMWLMAIDSFFKWVEVALMKTTRTEKTMKIVEEWIARNGVPKQIVINNGQQFISKKFENGCKK